MEGSKGERARGRWKLLRSALLGGESLASQPHSIHRFAGYNLLPVVECKDKHEILLTALLEGSQESIEDTALALLAASALDPTRPYWQIPFTGNDKERQQILSQLGQSGFKECGSPSNEHIRLSVPGRHRIRTYQLSPDKMLHVRERISNPRRSLQELTSHHHHGAVDNTGNICVWDCEKVLTWYLQQNPHVTKAAETILEIGAGMAGLAALSCSSVKEIYLTDGHTDCVWSNRIQVKLLQAQRRASGNCANKVHCSLVKWSYSDTAVCQADCTFVSDCTHFQEWHGQLLWTLLQNARVGGVIWMCQPDRGASLRNFFNLVHSLGADSLEIVEQKDATLQELHERYLKDDKQYDPDIHRPRIFSLKKMRAMTSSDCDVIQTHISERS